MDTEFSVTTEETLSDEAIIEIVDMHKWFGDFHVLRGINLTVHKQERIVICGPSGSGKSTIANALMVKLMEMSGRPVTLLDGDIVRKNLSSELGFSKEHRDLNIRRIGYVASEITKNGGIAICAPIAPYAATRRQVREMISPVGGFLETWVSTPLEVCEERDRKGLYAKARAGIIKGFTGVDGLFRLLADGTSQRGLAILEVQKFGTRVIQPAPASFGGAQF